MQLTVADCVVMAVEERFWRATVIPALLQDHEANARCAFLHTLVLVAELANGPATCPFLATGLRALCHLSPSNPAAPTALDLALRHIEDHTNEALVLASLNFVSFLLQLGHPAVRAVLTMEDERQAAADRAASRAARAIAEAAAMEAKEEGREASSAVTSTTLATTGCGGVNLSSPAVPSALLEFDRRVPRGAELVRADPTADLYRREANSAFFTASFLRGDGGAEGRATQPAESLASVLAPLAASDPGATGAVSTPPPMAPLAIHVLLTVQSSLLRFLDAPGPDGNILLSGLCVALLESASTPAVVRRALLWGHPHSGAGLVDLLATLWAEADRRLAMLPSAAFLLRVVRQRIHAPPSASGAAGAGGAEESSAVRLDAATVDRILQQRGALLENVVLLEEFTKELRCVLEASERPLGLLAGDEHDAHAALRAGLDSV